MSSWRPFNVADVSNSQLVWSGNSPLQRISIRAHRSQKINYVTLRPVAQRLRHYNRALRRTLQRVLTLDGARIGRCGDLEAVTARWRRQPQQNNRRSNRGRFRARSRHVQFGVIWISWCQVTSINQAFPVHGNFLLFKWRIGRHTLLTCSVLSKTWQELAAQKWHVGDRLCAPQVSGFAKHGGECMSHCGHNACAVKYALCVSNAFRIPKNI